MSESFKIELPGRFTSPALAELKAILDVKLNDKADLIFDGSAVATVDSAALQFLLVVQHSIDSRPGSNNGQITKSDDAESNSNTHRLSVLHSPSSVLEIALRDIGALHDSADTVTVG